MSPSLFATTYTPYMYLRDILWLCFSDQNSTRIYWLLIRELNDIIPPTPVKVHLQRWKRLQNVHVQPSRWTKDFDYMYWLKMRLNHPQAVSQNRARPSRWPGHSDNCSYWQTVVVLSPSRCRDPAIVQIIWSADSETGHRYKLNGTEVT